MRFGATMSTEAERQASNVSPPIQSDTVGIGVTILAATTTAAEDDIPDALFNRYVDFIAEGDKIWIAFSSADEGDVVDKSKAGGATFALGKDDQNGVPIANGARLSVRLNAKEHARVTWQADSTNSKLIVYPTSPASRTY